MASKRYCGKRTEAGTPCKNGPGCTLDHAAPTANRGRAGSDAIARQQALENATVVSDEEAEAADVRRREARRVAVEQTEQRTETVEAIGVDDEPAGDRPELAATIRAGYAQGDSDEMKAKIEQKVRWWDRRPGVPQGISGETAALVGQCVRAREALNELQDSPIRGEGYSEPDWLKPDRITRLRTKAEMDEWREQVNELLADENVRLDFHIIDGQVEAVAESHLGRVCCGNQISFKKTWCHDCGLTYSGAVLAAHKSDLTPLDKDGSSPPFHYRGNSLCFVGGEGELATRMPDPEAFARRARDTLEARITSETADAALGAGFDLDQLDAALHYGTAVPDPLHGIDFGMPEACKTFDYRLVLTTEPEDEDNTAAKDLTYDDNVTIEAHVATVTRDGAACWNRVSRLDAAWSPALADLCQ